MTVWRDLLPFCEKCRGSRRPIVMVLGMHRSGTSLCSHVLSALGLDMTDHGVGPRSRYAGRRQLVRALGAVGNCRVPRPHLALLQSRVIQPGPRFCVPDGMVGGPARRRGAARDHRVSRRAHGHRLFRLQGPAHSSADADVAPDHQRAEARTEDHLLPSQPSPGRPLAQPARRVQPRHRRISLVFVHSRFLPLYAIG